MSTVRRSPRIQARGSSSRSRAQPKAVAATALLDLEDGVQPTPTVVNLAISLALWRVANQVWTTYEESNYTMYVDWTYLKEQLGGTKILVPILINELSFLWSFLFYALEKVIGRMSYARALTAYYFLVAVLLTVPVMLLRAFLPDYTMLHGLSVSMQSAIHIMKAHSFYWTNRELAKDSHSGYLTVRNYVWWLFLPTFCFYPTFPRSVGRSWAYIAKQVVITGVSFFILYLTLTLDISPLFPMLPESPLSDLYTTSKLLVRFGIPMLIAITTFFTGVFHGIMNLLAELLRFGDRRSYMDWWNANGMDMFWRKWNYRVHEWTARHIYSQSQEELNMPRGMAMFISFLVSALLHEYCLLVAFRKLQFWTTGVMLAQILLVRPLAARAYSADVRDAPGRNQGMPHDMAWSDAVTEDGDWQRCDDRRDPPRPGHAHVRCVSPCV